MISLEKDGYLLAGSLSGQFSDIPGNWKKLSIEKSRQIAKCS